MALDEKLNVTISADTKGLDEVGTKAEKTGKKLKKMGDDGAAGVKNFSSRMKKLSSEIDDIGSQLTMKVSLPIVAGAGAVTKFAVDFESSFAGVRKTVNATEAEFESLSKGIRDMAKRIPIDVNELNATAEAAGQLGIQTQNILGFTEVMAKLGVTTNLSAGEAATALARLANITGMPQENFDRLGSTIVALGNNLATTESEIVEFGLRLAGAGDAIGLSEAQILGLGAAMSSLGLNAEAGGTAMSTVMTQILSAVETGNESLAQFADVAGMSTQDFAKAFKEDAAGAIMAFVKGLGEMEKRGGSTIVTLENMGLTEKRMRDALLRLSGASDLVANSLGIANDGWERNTALTEEARRRFETTASQLQLLWNQIKDVGITLGNTLLPIIKQVTGFLGGLIPKLESAANWFAELDSTSHTLILTFVAVVAAIGPVLTIVGGLIALLGAPFIGTIAAAVAILGALTVAGVAIVENWEEIKASFSRTWETLKTDFLNVKNAIVGIWEDLTESLQKLWDGFVAWLEDTIPGLKGLFDGIRGWIDETNEHSRKVFEATVKRANEAAQKQKEALANAAPSPFQAVAEDNRFGANDIVPPVATMRAGVALMTDYGDSLHGARTEMNALAVATSETGKETEKTTKETEKGADELTDLTDKAGGAKSALESLADSIAQVKDEIVKIGKTPAEIVKIEAAALRANKETASLADEWERLSLLKIEKTQINSLEELIKKTKEERDTLFLTNEELIEYKVNTERAKLATQDFTKEGLEKANAMLAEYKRQLRLNDAAKELDAQLRNNLDRFLTPLLRPLLKITEGVKKETEKGLTALEDFTNEIAGNINDSFADLINGVLRGNFDSLKDFWKSTLDSMLQAFSQFVAAIITNPIRISLESFMSGKDGKGYQIGDITRSVGGVLKGIPGVSGIIDKVADSLGKFAKVIPVVGDIVAGVLSVLPMLSGLFKKTPRLDIDFDSVKTELGDRAALVEELLDPNFFADEIARISVKRKAGLGAGGDDAIKKIIGDKIQEIVGDIQAIINRLPSDMSEMLNEALLNASIDTDTVVAGERLLEFDAKGKKLKEKFNAFINGELQAKFLFAIDDFLQITFESLGVLPEKASEFIAQKFAEFENAGSREARAAVGQEVLDALNAYVDAFNIVDGNLGEISKGAVDQLKALSKELGFETIPSLGEIRSELKDLITQADIDPTIIQKWVDLRAQIIGLVNDLASSIQSTIAQIQSISSEFGLGIDLTGATEQALNDILGFLKDNADSLSLEEKEALLNQAASLNSSLAGQQVAAAQAEAQRAADAQRAGIQSQIDQQRALREQVQKTFDARLKALQEELEWVQALERINSGLRDDLNNLVLSDASPLTGVEKLNRVTATIEALERDFALATTPEQQESIINQIRDAQQEALRIAGETFGVGSAEQIAIFEQTVERLNQLIELTDVRGRSSEEIQAEIERLTEEQNARLEGIDATINSLTDRMSSIGAEQVDATRAVSAEVQANAEFIVEQLQGILQEKLDLLSEVTGEGAASLDSLQGINEQQLVVQKDILAALQGGVSSVVDSGASGGGSGSAGGSSGTSGGSSNPFSPFYVPPVAMADGGLITEPIAGIGRSGRRYLLGERGIEGVFPFDKMQTISNFVNSFGSPGSGGRQASRLSGGGGIKDEILVTIRDEAGLSEESLEALEKQVKEGALGKVIVKRVQNALNTGGRL